MRFVGVRGASSESWLAGAVAGTVHFAVVAILILLSAHGSRDAGWNLAFVPLFLADLPVAAIAYPIGLGAARAAAGLSIHADPTFVMVAVAHGLFGSAFYLILPPAVSAHRIFRRSLA